MIHRFTRGLRGLGPTVPRYLLATGLVGFALDGGIYSVLLNLFLLRMEYGPATIGLVNSVGTFIFALASVPAGLLGARLGGRRVIVAGLLMMAVGCVALPLADVLAASLRLPWLVLNSIAIYLGLALFFVNQAPFLLGAVPAERRTQVIGLQTSIISLSAFAGSLFGGMLPPLFAGFTGSDLSEPAPYRYALIVAGVALLGSVVAIGGAPATQPPVPPRPTADRTTGKTGGLAMSVLWLLTLIAIVRMLQVAGVAALSTYTNVYLDAVLLVPTAMIGLIVATGRLIGAAAALTTAPLTRRFGSWTVIFWVSIISALSLLPIAFIPHWGAATVSFVSVIGLSWIRYTASLVYFLELTPEEARPTASGVLEMAAGVCFTIVTFGGGLLIAGLGYTALFLAAAAMTALSAATFWLFFRSRTPLQTPQAAADPQT